MGDVPRHDYGDERRPWARVAALARRQHHLITIGQLRALGLSKDQVEQAVLTGHLHPVHRGVYGVGALPATERAGFMAAVLATEGTLADRSASTFWEIWRAARSDEHVIVPRTARWEHEGIRPHRPRRFDRERDSVVVDGIRVTTPARTLLDLAAIVSAKQLRKALEAARVKDLVSDDDLRDVLARHPTHRGTRRLGLALTGPHTRSQLERAFLRLCRERGLPEPRANVPFGRWTIDFVFEGTGLVVEVDGRQHAGAWAEDAAKDAALRASGRRVVRCTWWDVTNDAGRTAARVQRLLGRRSSA
jgi:very-short-patch-repair endonuclease/predicted transcriptional regulator of viral defense system